MPTDNYPRKKAFLHKCGSGTICFVARLPENSGDRSGSGPTYLLENIMEISRKKIL